MNKKRKIILIFGKTGSGKTTFVKRLVKKLNRVIIIDKMFEYEDGIIFYKFEDLLNYFLLNKPSSFKFICRFENDIDIENLFIFCWYVKNLVLVVEEAEMYISPFVKQSNFLRLVRYGRHRGISIIAVARRVIEVSNDIKANSDKIVTFQQILEKDLEYLEKFGFNKEKVKNLKKYEFLDVTY